MYSCAARVKDHQNPLPGDYLLNAPARPPVAGGGAEPRPHGRADKRFLAKSADQQAAGQPARWPRPPGGPALATISSVTIYALPWRCVVRCFALRTTTTRRLPEASQNTQVFRGLDTIRSRGVKGAWPPPSPASGQRKGNFFSARTPAPGLPGWTSQRPMPRSDTEHQSVGKAIPCRPGVRCMGLQRACRVRG